MTTRKFSLQLLAILTLGIVAQYSWAFEVTQLNTSKSSGSFVPNRGQVENATTDSIYYHCRIGAMDVYFKKTGFSYVLNEKVATKELITPVSLSRRNEVSSDIQQFRLDVDFKGANPNTQLQPNGQQITVKNYVLYHATKDNPSVKFESNFIPCFSELYYRSVYPGIDIRFRVVDGSLKYDVIISAGANPDRVQFLYSSLTSIKNGCAITQTPLGEVIDNTPIAFQESRKIKSDKLLKEVTCNFKILSSSAYSTLVGFVLPNGYNRNHELIIDPSVIWGKYLGGGSDDGINDLVVLADNSILVCGESRSTDYPVTTGLLGQSGVNNMVITKLNADGTIVWSTYYGGRDNEVASGIDVDKRTNAIYVVGSSSSNDINFGNGVPGPSNSGAGDAVLVKFKPNGVFDLGTFHGGEQIDAARSVVVDKNGDIYMVGGTSSASTFPIIAAQQINYGGGQRDGFVSKFSSTQTTLRRVFSTYIGGSLYDEVNRVICDQDNNIYICGNTFSKDFPKYGKDVLQSDFKSTTTDQSDAFIASYGQGGIASWSTYFGGDQSDEGNSISINGKLIAMTGSTSSSNLPMYGTKQVFKRGLNLTDSYVVVASIADNNSINGVWSSFFGGNEGADPAVGIVLTSDSLAIIAGYTGSSDFPLKRSVGKKPNNNDAVCYVSALKVNDSLNWSSTFDIEKTNYPNNIKLDSTGNLVICYQIQRPVTTFTDGYILKICPFTPLVRVFPKQSDTLLCEGGTLTLLSDPNALDVRWDNNSAIIVSPTLSVTKTGKYWYTARNSFGCTATSDTVRIIIQPPITVTVNSQNNRSTLCQGQGDSITLSTADLYSSYRWIDATADTVLSTAQTYKAGRAGRFILEVTDAVGCKGKSQPFQITEISKPSLIFKGVSATKSIDTLKSITTLCQGDTILISPVISNIVSLRWSDDVRELSRAITSDTTISASFILDNSSCTWKSDSIKFVFTPSIKPTIDIPDKTCINSVITVKANPNIPTATYKWNTDGAIIIGSSNTSSIQLKWTSKGKKNISVGFDASIPCWLPENDSIVVEDELVGNIQIAGNTVLCPDESVLLTAPSGFKNYIWSNGRTTQQISILNLTKTKDTIGVQYESDGGCIGYDTVVIEQSINIALSDTFINYDSVRIDSVAQRVIRLTNNGVSSFSYSAELLDPLLRHFSIDSIVPPIGVPLSANDTAKIYVRFKPGNVNTLSDSLRIKILSPCVDSFFVSLQGIGKGIPPVPIMRFELNDFTYTSTERGIRIPVKAWLVPNVATLTFDTLLFTFQYNSTMLNILGVSKGNIVSNIINDYPLRSSITVSLPIQTLNFMPTIITEIIADGLLGNLVTDSIKISDADVRPLSKKEFTPFTATCTNSDVCQSGGSRLLGRSAGLTMMIAPNPVTQSTVTIHTTDSENSPMSLAVFTIGGELVWEKEWSGKVDAKHEHTLPNGLLAKGVYSVVLRSATLIERSVFVVLD